MKTSQLPGAIFLSTLLSLLLIGCVVETGSTSADGEPSAVVEALVIPLPFLEGGAVIDGDLSDWKTSAFHDGVWDIDRLKHTSWYEPDRNRLTDHGNEPDPKDDLRVRYYMAWDESYFYMGAEVHDNVNDVSEVKHEPKRWYYKDAICWFIEAPRDGISEKFGQGDNAFCFVIDTSRPDYGAWWRHGTEGETYIEEPIPGGQFDYAIRMDPWGESEADFILEARVAMSPTFGASDPDWAPPQEGDVYSVEIVHTDPDGGNYGGHFIVYGTGDDDASWGKMVLSGASEPIERKDK